MAYDLEGLRHELTRRLPDDMRDFAYITRVGYRYDGAAGVYDIRVRLTPHGMHWPIRSIEVCIPCDPTEYKTRESFLLEKLIPALKIEHSKMIMGA